MASHCFTHIFLFLCSKERRGKIRKKIKTKINDSLKERTTLQVIIDIYPFQKYYRRTTLQSNSIWDSAFLKQLTQKVFHLFSICRHIQVLLFGMGVHLDKMVSQITYHLTLQKSWKLQVPHIHLPTYHSDKICSSPCLLQFETTVQDHLHCHSA